MMKLMVLVIMLRVNHMFSCGSELQYVRNVKYLGVFLGADKKFMCC